MAWHIDSWKDIDYAEKERLQATMEYLLEKWCRCFYKDDIDRMVHDMVTHSNESIAFCRVFVNLMLKWNSADVMDKETLRQEREKRLQTGLIISTMSELADNCTGYWTEYANRIACHLNTFIDEFIEDSGRFVSTISCDTPLYGDEIWDVPKPEWKKKRTVTVERPAKTEAETN